MNPGSRVERRLVWVRRAALVIVALNLAGAGGVLALRSRDRATAVSIDDAVARFRSPAPPAHVATSTLGPSDGRAAPTTVAAAAAPAVAAPADPVKSPGNASRAAPAPRVPDQGVYVYDTKGYEQTDALGGAHHDYPARTTITVRHAGCGITTEWDPLEQRSDTTELCPAPNGGSFIASLDTRHAFFDRSDEHRVTCELHSVYQPAPNAAAGSTWHYRCASDTTTNDTTATLLGGEAIAVGGVQVDTVHIRQHSTAGGDASGGVTADLWLRTTDGLLVRAHSSADVSTQQGAIHADYREEYTLQLTTLSPQR